LAWLEEEEEERLERDTELEQQSRAGQGRAAQRSFTF